KAYIVSHPCSIQSQQGEGKYHVQLPVYAPLARNKHIGESSEVLVATPATKKEVMRSGTWSTIRYALKMERPVFVVYPDGTHELRGAPKKARKPSRRKER